MSSPAEPGVLIIAGCSAGQGGLQRHLSALATSLARDREVTVLTWRPWCRPRRQRHEGGVQVVVVPSLLDWGRDHGSLAAAANTGLSLLTGVPAAWLLRRRWSVACAAGLQPEGVVAALAARRGRRFVVATWLVGPRGNVERLRRSGARRVVLRLLRGSRWFVAETSEAARELAQLGVGDDRLAIVVDGVDLGRFSPRAGLDPRGPTADPVPRRAVYAGRFDLGQKRLDLLLDAWEEAALDSWELVLAGAGPDQSAVLARAQRIASVQVLGWQDDVAGLLRSADLFLLATEAETSALAMLEGMACGLPGIVSATAGLRARGPDGVLLAENRVPAWVEALRAVDALGPAGRQAAGRRARAWVQRHGDSAHSHAAWARLLR